MKHLSRKYLFIIILFFCFCSSILGSWCKSCKDTATAVNRGGVCSVMLTTMDEEGNETTVIYQGTWGATVKYKKCKSYLFGYCTDKDMTLKGKCGVTVLPNMVKFFDSDINVKGCAAL